DGNAAALAAVANTLPPGRAGNNYLLSCKTHGAYPPVARQDAPMWADRQASALAGGGQAVPASQARDKARGNVTLRRARARGARCPHCRRGMPC
ncbi:MAG: hypothetical protein EBU14_10915, partial [Acetobacteraceae bacterium]|nr:hypothetical protein [Acetobacteraceae bacterium]